MLRSQFPSHEQDAHATAMHSARVLIDGPSELVFDYAVPAGMAVAPGCRVRVPLRAKSSTGTVLALVDDPQPGFALREIAALTDPEPLITPVLLEIGRWIADYYGCRMETVMRALLPEAVRTEDHGAKTRRLAELTAAPPADELARLAGRAPRQHAIVSLLESAAGRRIAVADLGEGAAAALRGLVARGWVAIVEEAVHRDPEADSTTLVETTPLALTDEQAAALEVVRSAIDNPQSPIPNPQSAIPNPQSPIRNPQSQVPNPQSAIRNPQSQVPSRSCSTG